MRDITKRLEKLEQGVRAEDSEKILREYFNWINLCVDGKFVEEERRDITLIYREYKQDPDYRQKMRNIFPEMVEND